MTLHHWVSLAPSLDGVFDHVDQARRTIMPRLERINILMCLAGPPFAPKFGKCSTCVCLRWLGNSMAAARHGPRHTSFPRRDAGRANRNLNCFPIFVSQYVVPAYSPTTSQVTRPPMRLTFCRSKEALIENQPPPDASNTPLQSCWKVLVVIILDIISG